MTRTVKGLLVGCLVLVFLGVIVLAALGWYVKQKAPEMLASAQSAESEGVSFGKGVSDSQCVSAALERYQANRGIAATVTQSIWLDGCFQTSTIEEKFCDGVPRESDLMRSATWRVARCEEAGIQQDVSCPNLVGRVQTYCEGNVRRSKLSAVQ